jgi:hypothetical protein
MSCERSSKKLSGGQERSDDRIPVLVHTPGNEDSCICAACIARRNNIEVNEENITGGHNPSDPDCTCLRCSNLESSIGGLDESNMFGQTSPVASNTTHSRSHVSGTSQTKHPTRPSQSNKRAADPPLVSPDGKRQAVRPVSSRAMVLNSSYSNSTANPNPNPNPTQP